MTRLFVIILFATGIASAGAVDYLRDVKPVLQARCYACHGALKQKAGLRVDSAENLRKGSKRGDVLSLGQAEQGELLARLTAADADVRMPPEGAPLKSEEIKVVREWIAAGAPVPQSETAEADPREHWAFQLPRRVPLPGNAGNPIDDLLEARLAKRAWPSGPPADHQWDCLRSPAMARGGATETPNAPVDPPQLFRSEAPAHRLRSTRERP